VEMRQIASPHEYVQRITGRSSEGAVT
jgi:hypothetical protein